MPEPARSRSAAYEGKGGQQLLLERTPFCPATHCERCCDRESCTCRPCHCHSCRLRRLKARRAPARPLDRLPRREFVVQPRLFPTTTVRR